MKKRVWLEVLTVFWVGMLMPGGRVPCNNLFRHWLHKDAQRRESICLSWELNLDPSVAGPYSSNYTDRATKPVYEKYL
jgi:hypothetical protein